MDIDQEVALGTGGQQIAVEKSLKKARGINMLYALLFGGGGDPEHGRFPTRLFQGPELTGIVFLPERLKQVGKFLGTDKVEHPQQRSAGIAGQRRANGGVLLHEA